MGKKHAANPDDDAGKMEEVEQGFHVSVHGWFGIANRSALMWIRFMLSSSAGNERFSARSQRARSTLV